MLFTLPPNLPFSHATKWEELPEEVKKQMLAIECVCTRSLALAVDARRAPQESACTATARPWRSWTPQSG
jgi:hypothetical protein